MKQTITLGSCTVQGSLLVLQEHDGEFYLKVDGVPLMNTNANASEQLMAELACSQLPTSDPTRPPTSDPTSPPASDPSRPPAQPHILIGGLGFGFTLKRVLELVPKDATVVVAELLPEMVEWNRKHLLGINGHLLDDPRVQLHVGDVAEVIDRAGQRLFDAILLDVDNSPDALVQHENAKLYQRKGLNRARAALAPGGRIVYWSAHQDKAFARQLEKVFARVESVPAKAYPKAKRFSHTLFVADR